MTNCETIERFREFYGTCPYWWEEPYPFSCGNGSGAHRNHVGPCGIGAGGNGRGNGIFKNRGDGINGPGIPRSPAYGSGPARGSNYWLFLWEWDEYGDKIRYYSPNIMSVLRFIKRLGEKMEKEKLHTIAVIESGWIIIGNVCRGDSNDSILTMYNSSVVRKWSNGKGIGGLAKRENVPDYTLDPIGDVSIYRDKIIFEIACEW